MAPLEMDAVFEGGGVKGIGLVGALSVVEQHGIKLASVAGTSAGAIVAALVAAGYAAAELKAIVGTLDYNCFKQDTALDKVPVLGRLLNLVITRGMYESDAVYDWIEGQLATKKIRTFADLKVPGVPPNAPDLARYRLHVITSDVSKERLVVLPSACRQYGFDPDLLPVAQAVRMSMSIPFFFEPTNWQKSTFVDGGMLSNYPVWLFDDNHAPGQGTFGFKFIEPNASAPNPVQWLPGFAKAMVTTMMDAHDKLHVEEEDFIRTIAIPTLGVQATDFDIKPEQVKALYVSGERAARDFFQTWKPANLPQHVATRKANPDYQRKIAQLKSQMLY